MNDFLLKEKVAIVIGGSKGLGKGIAQGFAKAGAKVIIASRNVKELEAAKNEIEELTEGSCTAMQLDITSVAAISKFVDKVDKEFKRIDILVNSAGINIRKNALDFDESDWDSVMNIQLKYVFFMNKAIAKYMISKQIKGKIINMASLTSVLGFKRMVAYCAAKGGIVQMTKALANEWAEYGINVNAIAPGYYLTEMTEPLLKDENVLNNMIQKIPQKRLGEPKDLVGAALLLASNASEYITGQVIYVDGGWLVE